MRLGKNEVVGVERHRWKSWRKITHPGMILTFDMIVETCYSCDSDTGECKDTSLAGESSIMMLYDVTSEFQLSFYKITETFV